VHGVIGLALFDLSGDRGQGACLAELGAAAVAVGAPPHGDVSVPVGAGEAGVDGELVHLASEAVPPVALQVVVALAVVPEGGAARNVLVSLILHHHRCCRHRKK